MSLVKWNPFRELDSMFDFHPLSRFKDSDEFFTQSWTPRVDITESEGEYLIKAELPEVKKDDVKVSIQHGIMTLTGDRKYENTDEKKHRVERFYGSFTRSFTLPDNVQESDVIAEFKDGMLYLHLHKSGDVKTGAVDVEIQ